MKKVFLLLILFLNLSFNSYSQDYVPFVKDTTTWVIAEYLEGFKYITILGDTIFDGKNYSKVFLNIAPENVNDTDFSQQNVVGIIREENKKVYYKSFEVWAPSEELLIYDFSLTENDTFQLIHAYYSIGGPYYHSMTVSSIDSIEINDNEFRRRINLEGNHLFSLCSLNGLDQNIISFVEEIGIPNLHSFYYPYALECEGLTSFELDCVVTNGTKVFGPCNLTNTKEVKSNPQMLYPNPTNGKLFLSKEINNQTDIYLYSLEGQKTRLVLNGRELDISPFPNGIFFIEFVNSNSHEIFKIFKSNF